MIQLTFILVNISQYSFIWKVFDHLPAYLSLIQIIKNMLIASSSIGPLYNLALYQSRCCMGLFILQLHKNTCSNVKIVCMNLNIYHHNL